MASRLRSDSLHPCHHLSEPLRNMFWCRHCMKIFTDPIDRWRHSKTCREGAESREEGGVPKQVSLKEGTLFRFGVWDADPVISRPKGSASQYGIRIRGSGKVANHKGIVNPQNFDLQCVICRQPFRSIDEMRVHVKTPCSKAPDVQNVNRFPPEITNVSPCKPPVLQKMIKTKDIIPRTNSAMNTKLPVDKEPVDLFREPSPIPILEEISEEVTEKFEVIGKYDETDGIFLNDVFVPNDILTSEDLLASENIQTSENIPTSEDFLTPEKTPTSEDLPTPENIPTSEDLPTPENIPTSEDLLTPENIPTSEDLPTPENIPTSEDLPTPENIPTSEDLPTPEKTPTSEDLPMSDDIMEKECHETKTTGYLEDVSLVKLDGKIPTLQLSPVDMPSSTKKAIGKHSYEIIHPSEITPLVSKIENTEGKRKSSPDVCTSPVKIKKIGGEVSKPVTAKSRQAKKRGKRKKVFRKKKGSGQKKKSPENNKDVTPSLLVGDAAVIKTTKTVTDQSSDMKEPSEKGSINTEQCDKDCLNREALTQMPKPESQLLKKVTPRKPPRPRKCKICGRYYKSLEQLQRHNRLPCRVKLTRNQCAKLLRSNSQTSENGRLLQRRSKAVPKPAPNKIIPKRRQKKRAKKYPPPFRGNPRLPQYRLVFADLSVKEQFFFKLDLVPKDASLTTDSAIVKADIGEECPPVLEKELAVLSSLDDGDLFVDDEHISPPQLERISYVEDLSMDIDIELLEPPELEMINTSADRHFMDMVSPSVERSLTSIFSATKTGNKKKGKRGRMNERARKDRYSILHPIAKNNAKESRHRANGNGQSGHRTSQRLKEKALAKGSQDQQEEVPKESSNCKVAAGVPLPSLGESKSDKDREVEDTVSGNSPKKYNCGRNGDASCSPGSPSVGSPRKSLFESLSDISMSPASDTGSQKSSPLNDNQTTLLDNICIAKSRLGRILSPAKSKVKPPIDETPEAHVSAKTASDIKGRPSEYKTRARKPKQQLDGTPRSDQLTGNDVAQMLPNKSIEESSVPKKSVPEAHPAHKLKLARRVNSAKSLEDANTEQNCSTKAFIKPEKKQQIRFPLLASRGAPRQIEQPVSSGSSLGKTLFKRKRRREILGNTQSEKVDFCLAPKAASKEPVVKQSSPVLPPTAPCAVRPLALGDSTSNLLPSCIGSPVDTKPLAILSNPCTTTAPLPSGDSFTLAKDVQDIIPVESQVEERTVVHPSVTHPVEDAPLVGAEGESLHYIDQVTALVNYRDIVLTGEHCVEGVNKPEGGYTDDLGYIQALNTPEHNVIVEPIEVDMGIDLHTLEPQFQTIQFL